MAAAGRAGADKRLCPSSAPKEEDCHAFSQPGNHKTGVGQQFKNQAPHPTFIAARGALPDYCGQRAAGRHCVACHPRWHHQIAAKSLINDRASQTRVGIVAFSSAAVLVQAPTTNTVALKAAIDGLKPQYATAVGDAVLASLQMIFPQTKMGAKGLGSDGDQAVSTVAMSRVFNSNLPHKPAPPPVAPGSYRPAAIVLMTDGQNTAGADPIEAARAAANLGVRVFTIGFGTTNGQTIDFDGRQILAVLDEDTLKKMASMTNAQYFHAQSAEELTKVYKNLTTKLQCESQETEISVFFVAAATIFGTLSALLSTLWFHRIF